MFIAIISALLFYVLPTFLGRPIVRFVVKKSLPLPFVSYFMAGAALLYASIFLSSWVAGLLHIPFQMVVETTMGILAFILLPINLFITRGDVKIKSYILPFSLSLALTSVAYAIWQFNSPYPFNWDMYEHQTLVNTVLQGKMSLIPSQLTDTFGFDGYSTMFHGLIALSQIVLKPSIFAYWSTIGFLHMTIAVMASYLLTREITLNKSVATMAAIITAFAFDSSISFTTLFFIPQTATAVLFILLFTQMIRSFRQAVIPSVKLTVVNILFMLINHYIVGFVAVLIYAVTYLYCRFMQNIHSRLPVKRLIEAGIFMAFVTVLFSSSLSLGFLNKGEAAAYTLHITDKFMIMRQSYGFLLLLALPIGGYAAVMGKKRTEMVALLTAVTLLALVLTQLPYVMKFYSLARFFIDMFIALGIYTIVKNVQPKLRFLSYIILAVSLIIIFIVNASIWKGILHYQNTLNQVSNQEIQAGTFLKENYAGTNTLLISDPATQNILEAVSNVNSQGGAYMNLSSRMVLADIKNGIDTKDIASDVYKIQDKIAPTSGKRLLILSGRYFVWQESKMEDKIAFSYNVWYPADLTLLDIQKINYLLSDSTHFKLVYKNPAMVIVEVVN